MNLTTVDTATHTVGSRQKLFRALQASLILALLLSVGAIVLFALDNLLHLNAAARIILSLGFLAGAGVFWVRNCLNPLLQPLSREEAVIMIERAMPELDNRLINAERLRRDSRTPVEILTIIQDEAAQLIAVFDLRKVTPLNPLKKLALFAGVSVLALLLYAALLPDHFTNAFQRYTRPNSFIPPITRTLLTVVPGDITVVEGDTVAIKADVSGDIPSDARVFSGQATHLMRFVGSAFVHEFQNVESNFNYTVQAGDAQSQEFSVTVLKRCKIEKLALHYDFPEYLKLPARSDDPSSGAVSVVEGTRVSVALKTNKIVSSLNALISDGNTIELKDQKWMIDVKKTGSYTFSWIDEDKLAGKSAAYPITALKDQPPTVRLLEPTRDVSIQPDGGISIVIQAGDDFGLSSVLLKMRKGDKAPVILSEFPIGDAQRRSLRTTFYLSMKEINAKLGDAFGVFAVAKDLKGQEAASGGVYVHVVADATVKQEAIKEVKTIAARIREVIAEQKRVHGMTLAAKPVLEVLVKDQATIYKTLKAIYSSWDNQDLIHMSARKKLESVLAGPATSAVSQLRGDIPLALKSQTAIIVDLEAIVSMLEGVVAKSQTDGVDKALQQAAEKTPKQIAKDILAGLKDFENEQKKVIQETMDLKLKAAEDYTDEDKKKLDRIKQTEEKWGKFFQEKATDLSRLSPQDMTNGTSSKELNEIASEINAAAEKADKKATELAIPLEQGGLELAKTIESNIEKFLAGAPDSAKWNMEDNNKDVDVPMQDLPSELEDIIGDLIDKEDKLAEEAQDVTSNWLDSMDKGVGWGVSDGPISDMSAKGITGNVQPNNNEVNGRSGEGRNGKSSGQFAEKTADGKGGKQTPTRSTPDPFEAGRVEDKSKEESGGSTGGGKVSGGNKEGLRGVPPPPSKEKMDRLADSQADLRNAAEKANVAMQKRGYVSQDLVKAIDKMKGIEGQLRGVRGANYTGEMKAIGEKLSSAKKTVRDSIDVSRDTSRPLTKQRRDDMRNAMDEAVPSEFKDWVKEYYKSLSQ
ncbi:MAG: hypothetical protein WCT04_13320 [Planctomycetota bacterium]